MECLLSDCKTGLNANGHDLQYASSFVFDEPVPKLQMMLVSALDKQHDENQHAAKVCIQLRFQPVPRCIF